MAEKVKADYACTAQELYSIGETIYVNVAEHLPDFTSFKGKYTGPFLTALRDKILAAKALPDEEMRNAAFQTIGVSLEKAELKCCSNFQDLKNYIDDSYAKELHKIKYDAAGAPKYREASTGNHERCSGMNADMIGFINSDAAILAVTLAGDANMPAGFQAQVVADSEAFDIQYLLFKNARQTTIDTNKKILANNVIFKDIMAVCDDGQRVASKSDDPTGMSKLFTFKTVKDLVSPPGSSSLKVGCKSLVDGSVKVGLNVSIKKEGGAAITGVTDTAGSVLFENIDPAVYTVTISGVGIVTPIVLTKEVNTGVQARLDVAV